MNKRLIFILTVSIGFNACSVRKQGAYYQDDGPPGRSAQELRHIKDAVPKLEPLSKTGNKPYKVLGRWYHPISSAEGYRQRGIASWYGRKFHGRRTSSGETYDMYAVTAAHTTLPLPSYAEVINLENGRRVVVKVNDRGPFLHNRLIDLSYAAAIKLDIVGSGTGLVEVVAIGHGVPGQTALTASVSTPIQKRVDYIGPDKNRDTIIFAQLGAFAIKQNASFLQLRLASDGFDGIQIHRTGDQSTLLYRVRLGPFNSVEQADQIAKRLDDHGYAAKLIFEQHLKKIDVESK